MSRVGNQPISLPDGVSWEMKGQLIGVTGPLGSLSMTVGLGMSVKEDDGKIIVGRATDSRRHREIHGLTRSLIANMVEGVTRGFQKVLDVVGTGYRVENHADGIVMQLGFSHPVIFANREGIELVIEGQNQVTVRGIDKELVGRTAAELRSLRPPDAYKGKGVRYAGETVRLKPGKAAIGAGVGG
tara:strand:- start:234 stop:788 length:555 start_codon:yes stop_codon:yes gene_type:complete